MCVNREMLCISRILDSLRSSLENQRFSRTRYRSLPPALEDLRSSHARLCSHPTQDRRGYGYLPPRDILLTLPPSYPNFGGLGAAVPQRRVAGRQYRYHNDTPPSVFRVTYTGKSVPHRTPHPAQRRKKQHPLLRHARRKSRAAADPKKRYSVEGVQHEDEDPDRCRDCEHIGGVDVERPAVLAVIIVHETCRRYKPPATLFCHGFWFLIQYI